jgi:transcriptional regulator with XRE-family HTH domain
MGTNYREIKKTLKGVGLLPYVEVKNVPMRIYKQHGEVIYSQVLGEIERATGREIILRRLPIRGQEVLFFRHILGLSQRELAEKLGLSHVAILKWERAKGKRLEIINEIAFKVLMAGLLQIKILASLESLTGKAEFPKKLLIDYQTHCARLTA